MAICAYAAANTTIAYLGAPWALTLLGDRPHPGAIVLTGMVLVLVCALVGRAGRRCDGARGQGRASPPRPWRRWASGSRCCWCSASRTSRSSAETLGAEALSGGSTAAALLAALAVGGWVFIGFDACVGASEETRDAARHVPRAIWIALLSVAALVILNAVAVTLAHPDPAAVVAGKDLDPVTTAVVTSFGSWSSKPFAAVVLVGVPGVRDRRAGAHRARDLLDRARRRAARVGVLRRSTAARRRRRDRGHGRRGCLGLLLGLESAAVGSLIAFGTAAIYLSFLLTALAALIARRAGHLAPAAELGARARVTRWRWPGWPSRR